jgi:hypothetical protein
MKLFYLDDSGSSGLKLEDEQQPLFVLGGVVIDDKQWKEIDRDIQTLKQNFGIQNYEIHALEIANGKGAFKGWDFAKKQDFIARCLQIISKKGIKTFYFKVIKANYKAYFERNFSKAHQKMVKIPPYILAYSYILQIAEQYLQDTNDNGILIADEQDTQNVIANDTLKVLRAINEPEIKINRVVEKSFFINSRDSNLLQLADIFAYYVKRYYEIELKEMSDKSKKERENMFELIKNSIYEPKFDYSNHKILQFIRNRLDEE